MSALLSTPNKNGIQKTLAAELLSTAGIGDPITFDDVDGIPNLPGVLVIDRIDASGVATPAKREYIEYSGTSGTTVLITARNADSSASAMTHAVGAIVEFVPDVVWAGRIYTALGNVVSPSDLSLSIHSSGATITAIKDEDDMASNSAVALPTQQSVKAYVDTKAPADGWISAGETWTYASATTITVPSGAASRYQKGMPFKLTANSVELQGYIVGIADTVLTVRGDSLTNHTFTNNYYAQSGTVPIGFDDVFSYTPTLTGFSANPTFTASFSIKGNLCFVRFTCSANGTSNATTFTVSLPLDNTGGLLWKQVVQVVDNNVAAAGMAIITTVGTTIGIRANVAEGNFTNSGNKSANVYMCYSI